MHNWHDPTLLLLVQVGLILGLSRVVGLLFLRVRQPQVVGEMVAGILLGPSLLGWAWPAAHHALFPAAGMDLLQHLSQFGVVFFLFLIGLELDPRLIRSRGRAAAVISLSSIAVPFVLGAALTFVLFARGRFDDPVTGQRGGRVLATALFMGAALAVTAFPVLARILTEQNLHKTRIGVLAIACAASNDAVAWVILAFVVAVANATGPGPAVRTLFLAAGYVAAMLVVVRPFLRRLQLTHERQGRLSQDVIAVVFLLILASAWVSSAIGIHAMFGAFLVGAIMPKGTQFVRTLADKLEDFTVVLLLPLFFAYSGLKTQIGLLNTAGLWADAGLIVLVACAGKFGGSALAGRAVGLGWREAGTIGILMNTRGLMELVILNVGRDLGVITPAVFAMMVLMALTTTALTTPLLQVVFPRRMYDPTLAGRAEPAGGTSRQKKGRDVLSILLPVADPRTGGPLLRLAELISGAAGDPAAGPAIYALHLSRPEEHDAYRAGIAPIDATESTAAAALDAAQSPGVEPGAPGASPMAIDASLGPLLDHARKHNIAVEPIIRTGRDVAEAVAAVARQRQVDLILMGFHRAVIGKAVLGGAVHRVLETAPADVGVLVDRGFLGARRVLVPYMGSSHDRLAMDLAARLGRNAEAEVTVLHVVPPGRAAGAGGRALGAGGEVDRAFRDPSQPAPVKFRVVEDAAPVDAVLREAAGFDLIVVGVAEAWGTESHLFGFRAERIAEESDCSLLLVRKVAAAQKPGAEGKSENQANPAPARGEPAPVGAGAPI